MTRGIVVFLGPSCDRRTAREILEADYRPPARRGDVARAVEAGARIIGLIDGVFFQESAVAHREILAALRAGVRVVGASSMGALRAAELDSLGMEGVGEIYRAYREGRLVSDDEVALVFDPETFVPLSDPLVNIRATLQRALECGAIDADAARGLLDAAKGLYFPERTYDAVIAAATGTVDPEALARFAAFAGEHAVDQKRKDAILALERIRDLADGVEPAGSTISPGAL
ncbi:MAG TPA: TfuA-related McrA-glycine thioamidation protein [Candidatus Methanoculleus thermohydrogenotrophicum]|nr:TfuA-related McrA-glycine thioamidation protein [Candidatus Methanoculleus thermohydrogenotrophicum]NLM82593.1 TfuA-related McrA-glycine thioamidation protein [Candidatus Methanoculleus thermohydrogenotrophicum]HOB18088.1 TfuA-related McrA-glycine thioamidation protein [Candidatus Methanoculleus thermohydrogenotrophicum]HPZ37804.1 TfuA-related McrA-glycine thioamidation protein [Candidatus Methanoculleus thermohydrogenotrophicum]HQC91993.1 TfuA-related McrA-glycine thioamidation protein [Can